MHLFKTSLSELKEEGSKEYAFPAGFGKESEAVPKYIHKELKIDFCLENKW